MAAEGLRGTLINLLPKMEINEKQIALNSLNYIDSDPVLLQNFENRPESDKVDRVSTLGYSPICSLGSGHKCLKVCNVIL